MKNYWKIICPFIEISSRRFRDWGITSVNSSFLLYSQKNLEPWGPQWDCLRARAAVSVSLVLSRRGEMQSFDKAGWRTSFIFPCFLLCRGLCVRLRQHPYNPRTVGTVNLTTSTTFCSIKFWFIFMFEALILELNW